jgi:translocation and assembly module TamB
VITVQNGAFLVIPTNVSYANLNGLVELLPDKVRIGAISVLDNHQNALNISGDLAIREREIGAVQIDLHADDFKVIDNKMGNVRIYSALQVNGELRAPRVDGDLGITTGQIDLDQILAKLGDSAYATQQTEFATGVAAAAEEREPSVFDALQMDVHLTVPNDLVIKANDLKAPGAPIGLGALTLTLGGDLHASKSTDDQVRLIGTVNTVRGTYDFQGRRFTILRDGTVRFAGGDDFDPLLDIRTERIIRAVTARVDVRGTLQQPEIVLSSTPPLPQDDILALIVFNQDVNSLGEGQQISLAQRAQSLATGAATSALAQSIGSALNLDTFELDLGPENGNGPSLTIGQQVGQNLYVKVEQGIGDQSRTNFIVEYEINKWLRLQTNVLQGSNTQQNLFQRVQGSGVDLLFFFSY